LADEADDVLLIVEVAGVAGDAGAFVGGDLVLVDDPIEGAAVAEAVVEDFGRACGSSAGVVKLSILMEALLIGCRTHESRGRMHGINRRR